MLFRSHLAQVLTGAGTDGPGAGARPPLPAKEVIGDPLALIQGMDELVGVLPVRPVFPGLMMLQQHTEDEKPVSI